MFYRAGMRNLLFENLIHLQLIFLYATLFNIIYSQIKGIFTINSIYNYNSNESNTYISDIRLN